MWPLQIVPDWVADMGHMFPTAWAMDAYLDLAFAGAKWTDILPSVAALLLMAAVLATIGVVRLRRALVNS